MGEVGSANRHRNEGERANHGEVDVGSVGNIISDQQASDREAGDEAESGENRCHVSDFARNGHSAPVALTLSPVHENLQRGCSMPQISIYSVLF